MVLFLQWNRRSGTGAMEKLQTSRYGVTEALPGVLGASPLIYNH